MFNYQINLYVFKHNYKFIVKAKSAFGACLAAKERLNATPMRLLTASKNTKEKTLCVYETHNELLSIEATLL